MEVSDWLALAGFFWTLSTGVLAVAWFVCEGIKWPMRYLHACFKGRGAAENVMNCWDPWKGTSHWFCSKCGYVPGSKPLPPAANACPTCQQERWRVGRIALFDGARFIPPPGFKIIGTGVGVGQLSLHDTRRESND